MQSRLRSLCVLVSALFIAMNLFGQTTASVTGTVTDSSGAAVANAEVTVTMPERGLTRTTNTNGSGEYLLPRFAGGYGQYRGERSRDSRNMSPMGSCSRLARKCATM